MKAYLPHLWTVLLALVFLAVAGIMFLYEQTVIIPGEKHVEKGWPLVYSKQDFAATIPVWDRLGPGGKVVEYFYSPRTYEDINQLALWTDVGVVVLIFGPPVALCEWFLRRRRRLHSKPERNAG